MAYPPHESIVSILTEKFLAAKSSLSQTLRARLDYRGSLDTNDFTGRYEGSTKAPDFMVRLRNANGSKEVKLVAEVGFSENYDDLVEDAKLWLEGKSSVSAVLLAKYVEDPPYQNPLRGMIDDEIQELQIPSSSEIVDGMFTLEGDLGPATWKGLLWAGRVSGVLFELWKRNEITGLAEQQGARKVSCILLKSPIYVKFHLPGSVVGPRVQNTTWRLHGYQRGRRQRNLVDS